MDSRHKSRLEDSALSALLSYIENQFLCCNEGVKAQTRKEGGRGVLLYSRGGAPNQMFGGRYITERLVVNHWAQSTWLPGAIVTLVLTFYLLSYP